MNIKEGLGMPRVILIAAVTAFSVLGLLSAEFAIAERAEAGASGVAGPTDNIVG
jgi:Flp pilus assembly protein CpaB